MRRQIEPKNGNPICTSRYCPVNSSDSDSLVPGPKPLPPTPQVVLQQEPVVLIDQTRRRAQIDESLTNRNRELRRQLDINRADLEAGLRQKSYVVQGPAELTKLRLIVVLQKLQTADPPISYSLLFSYFQDCLKVLDQRSVDISVISNALVEQFDKDSLKDSNSCYVAALASINKMKTTNFTAVTDMVSGLAEILNDIKK